MHADSCVCSLLLQAKCGAMLVLRAPSTLVDAYSRASPHALPSLQPHQSTAVAWCRVLPLGGGRQTLKEPVFAWVFGTKINRILM